VGVLVIKSDNQSNLPMSRKSARRNKLPLFLTALITLASVGALCYVLISPPASKPFTEFYLLDQNGKTNNYPSDLKLGEQGIVLLGIVNHEAKELNYRVEVVMDGNKINDLGPITLVNKTSWQTKVEFIANTIGDNQEVDFLLFKDGETAPSSDSLSLSFNVR
jgi:uncharacterized membrane protein